MAKFAKKTTVKTCCSLAFLFTVFGFITLDISSSDEIETEEFGVSYWIEEKSVEEIYYATMEMYGFLNDVSIEFNSKPSRSVIAISVENAVINGELNHAKFSELHESYFELLKAAFPKFDESQCRIGGVKTPDVNADGIVIGEELTMVVIFNNRGNSVEEQLVCLYLGTLLGLGVPSRRLEYLASLKAEELARILINGEY